MFILFFTLLAAAGLLGWLFFKIHKIENEIQPRNVFTEMKDEGPTDEGPVFMAPPVDVPPIKKNMPNIRLLGERNEE